MRKNLAFVIVLLCTAPACAQQTQTFSNFVTSLPAATLPLDGTSPTVVIQNGASRKISTSSLTSGMFPGFTAFWINSSIGNDSFDCLADSIGSGHGPCLTLQRGVNVALAAAMRGGAFARNTLFVDGNFTKGAFISAPPVQGQQLLIKGVHANGADSIDDTTGTVCGTLIISGSGTNVLLSNITLKKTVSCGGGDAELFVQALAYVAVFGNFPDVVIFSGSGISAAMHAEDSSVIEAIGPIQMQGGHTSFFSGSNSAELLSDGGTVTCTNTPSISNYWWSLGDNSTVIDAFTYSGCGSVGGNQFLIAGGSILDLHISLANVPGTGGFYRTGARILPPPTPSLGTCGNGSMDANSSDDIINVAFSGGNGSCSVNFALTKFRNPVCTITPNATSLSVAVTGVNFTGNFNSGSPAGILCQGNPD